ncbi:FkbM family methyltransferase [Bradyrhizobium sp. LTSP857]|uniref:FkbM family methyltransferase n=1 Tax=Bradyrhizobium sp. LTSP857 TaxID=1619231 RepID=UPI0005D29D30|nr:FkbM family methyltransferase [Bradyrhizobium sp. LTSP857]KJC51766.1 hypothetical protein UP06_01495 [Bradyrhizobium sp. LTSP857]
MQAGDFSATLQNLFEKGVRYGSVIDLGCADGHFVLNHLACLSGAVPLNVDANRIYEASLKAIKEALGGHYRICAVTDHEGEIEITESVHPYWSSVRPAGDIYWSRVNDLTKSKVKVPATRLDTLVEELSLKPPFLLKLDVQGAILEQNKKILNRLAFGQSKVGRNDPCPCGSGQKFKHCCGSY